MNPNHTFLCRFGSKPGHRRPRGGFSLVELLVVVGIIMLVAASSLLVLDQTDDQARYDKTRQGYKEVKTALFGPDMMTTIGGNLVISGFLADTGRLPRNLNELMVRPADIFTWGPVVLPSVGGRIQHGWRGPYLSQTESGLNDAWGNLWLFDYLWDLSFPPEKHYRPGFFPSGTLSDPPTMRFGSLGKDHLPDDPTQQVTDLYNKDFPETGPALGPEHFVLRAVPLPERTIEKQSAHNIRLLVGVIHAGMNIRDYLIHGDFPGGYNPCLLRHADGSLVYVDVPGNAAQESGGGSSNSSGSGNGEDDDDDDDDDDKNSGGGSPSRKTGKIPAGLTYNLGYARQLQLALFVDDLGGNVSHETNNLSAKLYRVDPVAITYSPKISSSGAEATMQNPGSTGPWLIP